MTETIPPPSREHLAEVVRLMLRLGFTAFGGPAAHVAMMHDEVVERRKWVSEQHFLDMLGATNLIPGPNSTEMTIHLGFVRAGWPGLLLAGASFITPAMLMVTALAWAYVRFGSTPAVEGLLYGIKPVVIAVIASALFSLGKKAVKGVLTAAVGVAVLGLFFLGIDNVLLLVGGGALVMLVINAQRLLEQASEATAFAPLGGGPLHGWLGRAQCLAPLMPAAALVVAQPFSLTRLFLTFLKIGSVLYGSGYTLLAFLEADFVRRLGWLTTQQIVDAVAVGQLTPGPVFTTATFIGYVLGGFPGAILATVGIFLPAFILVAISNPFIPRLRESPWAGAFLDGVNVAALGLMAAVTIQLARAAFVDVITVGIALAAAVLIFRYRVNTTWLILGSALIGLAATLLR